MASQKSETNKRVSCVSHLIGVDECAVLISAGPHRIINQPRVNSLSALFRKNVFQNQSFHEYHSIPFSTRHRLYAIVLIDYLFFHD